MKHTDAQNKHPGGALPGEALPGEAFPGEALPGKTVLKTAFLRKIPIAGPSRLLITPFGQNKGGFHEID